MTDPVEERSYRWARRSVFAAIAAVIIFILILWFLA
jgi:hypothetical protein